MKSTGVKSCSKIPQYHWVGILQTWFAHVVFSLHVRKSAGAQITRGLLRLYFHVM